MNKKESTTVLKAQLYTRRLTVALISVLLVMLTVLIANAFEFDTGSPDWKVRWDNTLKFTTDFRVADQNNAFLSNINIDDGDRSFNKGLTELRTEDLTEFDVAYRDTYGFRVSATGWVDPMYLRNNDNNSPATFNGTGPNNQFAGGTKELSGLDANLLDAFVYGKDDLGSMPASWRVGRYTLLWGETLFFPDNGIAYGMGPLDLQKALSVPSTEAKELFLPVGQVSGQVTVAPDVTVASFADFEWRSSLLPAAGSYFSFADFLGAGAKRLLLSPNPPNGLGEAFWRGDNIGGGSDTGQFGQGQLGAFGMALRFRVPGVDADWGLYYHRYDDSFPQVYVQPGVVQTPGGPVIINPKVVNLAQGQVGEYFEVFPENIHMLGASVGTQVGDVNVSGEVSGRLNTPLVSSAQVILPGMQADNNNHPLYAVGNTFHANVSATYLLPPGPSIGSHQLWQGGNLLGEIAYNCLIDVTDNPAARSPSANDYAMGFRMIFEPAYYQVRPGVDLTFPLGLGFNPVGNSPVDPLFNGTGPDKGGDVDLGITVTYHSVWKGGITYTNYFGSPGSQLLLDRDNVSVYVQRSF